MRSLLRCPLSFWSPKTNYYLRGRARSGLFIGPLRGLARGLIINLGEAEDELFAD